MSLKDQINNDLKTALLGGDRFVKQTLNSLRSSILNQEIALGKREEGLNNQEIETMVVKEIKKRKDALAIYQNNNRLELAENEQAEIDILTKYLPQQLTESDLNTVIDQIIADQNLELTSQNMGMVIGLTKKQVGNKADGSVVAQIIKQKIK